MKKYFEALIIFTVLSFMITVAFCICALILPISILHIILLAADCFSVIAAIIFITHINKYF